MQQKLVNGWGSLKSITLGCHGIPDRCLGWRGYKMKVCSRCFGSTLGHVFSFVLFVFDSLPSLYFGLFFIVIMLIDWSLQTFVKIPSTNVRRVITGFFGGLGVGVIFWSVVNQIFNIFVL